MLTLFHHKLRLKGVDISVIYLCHVLIRTFREKKKDSGELK